ncbi:MAG: response regulator [Candidatus Binatia bacterium]
MIQDKPDEKDSKKFSDKVSSVTNQSRVLLAEDDDELRKLLAWSLRREGYHITECADGMCLLNYLDSFLLQTESRDYDLIISDIRMPGISGLEILKGLHACEGFPPMIMITAFGDEETHAQAHRLGAAAIFDKPFDIENLLAKVREILSRSVPFGNKLFLSLKKDKKPIRFPLNIVFRHVLKSEQVEAFVRRKAAKLNPLSHEIADCRVVIDMPHHHHKHGNLYHVRITLSVSGQELVIGHCPGEDTGHNNLSVAISDAFDAACHQVRIYLDKHKTHRD